MFPEEPAHRGHQRRVHLFARLAPVEDEKPRGLFARQLEESFADPLVELDGFLLQPVAAAGRAVLVAGVSGPGQAGRRIDVQQQGQVGPQVAGGHLVHAPNHLDRQAEVLLNAPDAREGFFAVPKVVE